MSKSGFIRCGLAVFFLCSIHHAAFGAVAPTSAWTVAPIAAKGADGGSFCSMKASYPDGQSLVFARESMGENSIAIDFQKYILQPGDELEVKVQSGSVVRPMAATASSKQVLVMQTGIDTVLYGAFARKHTVDFTIGRKTHSYELDVSAADALAGLEQCVENLQAGQPFKPVSFPLGTVHQAALQQVAQDYDVTPAPAQAPAASGKKKHKHKQAAASAPAEPALDIEVQDPSASQGGEPTPSDLARDSVKTEIAADLLKMTGGGDIAPPPPGGVTSPPAQPVDAVEGEPLSDAKTNTKAAAKPETRPETKTAETPKAAPAAAVAPVAAPVAAKAPAAATMAAVATIAAVAEMPKEADKMDSMPLDDATEKPVAEKKSAAQAETSKAQPAEKVAEADELPPPPPAAVAAAPAAPPPAPVAAPAPAVEAEESLPPPVASPPAYLRASPSQIREDIEAEVAQKKAVPPPPVAHPAPQVPVPPPDTLDLRSVLTSSHVTTADQIKAGDNNALSWTTADGLYGSAEQTPLPSGENLTDTANDYLHKTAALCKGDFAQKLHEVNGSGKLNALEADITCLDGENNPAAAVLFISKQGSYSVITEEGTIDQLHNAMTNRDAILAAAIGQDTTPSATSAKVEKKPVEF